MVDKLRCCCKIQAQAELDGKMWSGGKSDGKPHDELSLTCPPDEHLLLYELSTYKILSTCYIQETSVLVQ